MKTLFAIFGTNNPAAVKTALEQHHKDAYFELTAGQWMVVAEGTAKEMSDRLGLTTGDNGNGVVVASAGYFGRAPSNIWEWILAKMKTA